MSGKFAKVRLNKNIDEIGFNNPLIKRSPAFIRKWYVENYMPLSVVKTTLCGVSGFEIALNCDNDASLEILRCEAGALGVTTMFAAGDITLPHGFFLPTGQPAKALFLDKILDKAIRTKKIDPAHINLIIIEGGKAFTEVVLESLYHRFNYLGLILENSCSKDYSKLASYIFNDCGLNINFGRRGSYLLKEADIIINLSESERGYESFYKKKACYIELGLSGENPAHIREKRKDILAVDGFYLSYEGEILPLRLFEMLMYLDCKPFYNFVKGRNIGESFKAAKNWVEYRSINVRNLNF